MRTLVLQKPLKIPEGTHCFNWQGDVNNSGYAVVFIKDHQALVSRLLMRAGNYQEVLHMCDNPLCINKEHLVLGTHKENMLDAQAKKRMAWGEKHKQTTLSNKEVREMRKEDRESLTYKEIGKKYNVSESTAYNIINYKTWRHLDNDLLKEYVDYPEDLIGGEEAEVPGVD